MSMNSNTSKCFLPVRTCPVCKEQFDYDDELDLHMQIMIDIEDEEHIIFHVHEL